jgi:hypothetical protein
MLGRRLEETRLENGGSLRGNWAEWKEDCRKLDRRLGKALWAIRGKPERRLVVAGQATGGN